MDKDGQILQLQGKLGGKTRALKAMTEDKTRLVGIIREAQKLAEDHRQLCAQVNGHNKKCEGCMVTDGCWEFVLCNILGRVDEKVDKGKQKKK
jgi:hypothetical protein